MRIFQRNKRAPLLSDKEFAKVRFFEGTFIFARNLLSVYILLNILQGSIGLHSFFALDWQGTHVLFLYGMALAYGCGILGATRWHADLAGYLVMLGIALRVLMFESNSMLFFINHAQRLLLSLLGGFYFFDYRKAVGCSCIIAITHIYRFHDQLPVCPDIHGDNLFSSACFTELMCLCMAGVVFYLVDMKVDACLSATIDKQVAETTRHAAQMLLSVLCDADVVLAHDLRILGQAAKLSHILSSVRPSNEVLEGRSFLSLLRKEDQTRFHNFIQASSLCKPNSDLRLPATGVNPPSSLQVCICDPDDERTLKVDVFHVVLPDIREPNETCHLLGLRENVDIVASSRDVKKIARDTFVPEGKCNSHVHRIDTSQPTESRKFIERVALGSSRESDSHSLSSDGSSEKSVNDLPQVAGIEAVVLVGGDNVGIPIESLTINFNLAAFEGLSLMHRPDLQNWLLGSASKNLRGWLTNQANRFIYDDTCDKYGRAEMRSPFGGSKKKVIASQVALAWAEEDEDDCQVRAQIDLCSFSEKRSSGKSKSVKDLEFWQPMPIIEESR